MSPSPPEIEITRRDTRGGKFSLLPFMRVEKGTVKDWDQLHELHYKAEGSPFGPHYWRCMLDWEGEQRLVGVVILSSPKLLLAPRHSLFPKLKPGHDTKLTNVYRAKFINKNFKLNSRSVVDTMFRSVGASYRMLNLASRLEGLQYVEIQSSMSKFNPFAQRAGFVFTPARTPPSYEKGLALFKRHFTSHPADQESVLEELAGLPEVIRNKTLGELKHFYYKNSAMEKTGSNLHAGTSKVDAMEAREVLKNLNQLVFASPMYGVYKNPDCGRKLPESLPMSAFDNQKPSEPLRLDLL